MAQPVVVDTNILFSALLSKKSRLTEVLLTSGHRFYVNELVLTEIFKQKEKIIKLSTLPEDEVIELFYRLTRIFEFFKEDLVTPENRRAAYELCKGIDETDAPHVAITLELGGLLWTGDGTLKRGLRARGFTSFFEP